MRHLINFWVIFSGVVVLGGAVVAIVREINRRRLQFLHEKAAFLSELHQELECNPAITRAVTLLKGSDIEHRLGRFLTSEVQVLSELEQGLKNDLDALFKVLNRIAHAVSIAKILTRDETEAFSWYFRLIQHHAILAGYFYNSGFLDLWDYAQSLLERGEG
jgi:hypothetical protein